MPSLQRCTIESGNQESSNSTWSDTTICVRVLRQSFRTIVTAAGVSEFDAKLLMNHAIPAVNAGYSPSTSFSRIIFAAGNLPHRIRDWLERDGSQRLGLAADVD